jgi:type I restriction enzyme S subunit
MSANRETVVPTGRKKLAQGKERSGDRQPTGCCEAVNEVNQRTKEGGELPQGWRRLAVKDVADYIQYGHTASAVVRKDGPRFLRITDIQDGRVESLRV